MHKNVQVYNLFHKSVLRDCIRVHGPCILFLSLEECGNYEESRIDSWIFVVYARLPNQTSPA